MNQAKDKVISIAHTDDKRQITAIVAASMSGECIPIQLLYQGKTVRKSLSQKIGMCGIV